MLDQMPVRRTNVTSGEASSCRRFPQSYTIERRLPRASQPPIPRLKLGGREKKHGQGMSMREPTASSSSVSLEVPRSKNEFVPWRGMAWNNVSVSTVHARLVSDFQVRAAAISGIRVLLESAF